MTIPSDEAHSQLDVEHNNSASEIEQQSSMEIDLENHDDANEAGSADVIDSIEHRVKLVADALFIYDERAWFLAAMFNPEFYAQNYELTDIESTALFQHFLDVGIAEQYSPSPAFDPAYTATKLPDIQTGEDSDSTEDIEEQPIFVRWLSDNFHTVVPHALFDAEFYLDRYSDLAETVKNPYAHFATTGLYENRIPCEFLQKHINSVYTKFDETPASVLSIFSSIPVNYSAQFLRKETQVVLKKIFMPDLYKKQLGIENDYSEDVLYSHFLVQGSINQHRPTALFNSAWYLECLDGYKLEDPDTDTLREFKALSAEKIAQLQILGTATPFFHWFFNGMQLKIIPTPLFDTDSYLTAHPDIRNNWKNHPFMHFIETGYTEQFRRHSVMFNANYYRQAIGPLEYNSAILDFTMRGQFDEIAPVGGLQLEHFPASNPYVCSSVEEAAIYFHRRTNKLSNGPVADMIAKATALEAQVVRPYGPKLVRMAPVFHPESDLMHDMQDIIPDLAHAQYDIIILMPHCRMAGSANVAGQFTKTVSELSDGESILVITTDLSAFERPDWFPENVDVFDLSQHLTSLQQERKIRILLDIVRGLRVKKLVNINSNLGWHLTDTFGKQLAEWMDIYFYLFCWDRDAKGNKGGYPIQWFLPSFNYTKAVFTDNNALRTELQDRYCLTDESRKKIVTLHTPAAETSIDYQTALSQRISNTGVRRVFWSGRFDKQKRIDVLLAIAKRMPEIEFWVWGKRVLNDSDVGMNDAPSNIRLMGTYQSIDDLPIASCDCFLYTSGWDGLPIILIDVASRGIPIVASAVGGVGDLVSEDTGWPIKNYANPDDYCAAINELLGNYTDALERGKRGREHALALCSDDKYRDSLRSAMQLGTDK